MEVTKELLSSWFKTANELYFNNEIEKEPTFIISNNKSRYGCFSKSNYSIEITNAYDRSERDFMNTFLHELCHLYAMLKYGNRIKPHGDEWQNVAYMVTIRSKHKYGTIKRVGGGQDEAPLRVKDKKDLKENKFIIFTDYEGKLSIVKCSYGNMLPYLAKMKRLGAIKDNTKVYFLSSSDMNLARYKTRKLNANSVNWNYLKLSVSDLKLIGVIYHTEIYIKTSNAA